MIEWIVMIYVAVSIFVSGGLVFDEMSFKNPRYAKAFLIGWIWPLIPLIRYLYSIRNR